MLCLLFYSMYIKSFKCKHLRQNNNVLMVGKNYKMFFISKFKCSILSTVSFSFKKKHDLQRCLKSNLVLHFMWENVLFISNTMDANMLTPF